MLPISAIVGVSTVGYLLDQFLKKKNYEETNENANIPQDEIHQCADQYQWNYLESFDDVTNENNTLNIPSNIPSNKMGSYTFGPLYQSGPNKNEPSPLTPSSVDSLPGIYPLNNNEPEYFINTEKRPVENFTHNNMVPFFRGSSTKQCMKGTGVPSGNYDADNYNLGNDNRSPYHQKLGIFTGYDETYLHKREAPEFFSPLERRDKNTIPGENPESVRPELDRYTTSILRKPDEKPFESIQVGPGLNLDYNMPNDSKGFNSGLSTQIKPNNINEYKINQLSSRVAGEKYQYSNLPQALPGTGPAFKTSENSILDKFGNVDSNNSVIQNGMYGVPNNRPDISSIDILARRPLVETPASVVAPMVYSNSILPSKTKRRENTNVSFGGSVQIK